MRISILITLLIGTSLISAQNYSQNMENKKSTLRLLYPQWQGGIVNHWMPDLPTDDASRGYYLGSQLLNFLAPKSKQKTVEVPVSLDINDRASKNGINSYDAILRQTKVAIDILNIESPDKIVTLGGDCAVSVVPFTYMASKYPDDVAIVWIDAHPDINMPGDSYEGYHAMALAACMGLWDDEITSLLPKKIDTTKALLVGLREWDSGMKERQHKLGIKGLSPSETAANSSAVIGWLKSTGVSKVMIHFDLDVLEPAELVAAVGVVPEGMKIAEVVRLINDISAEYDLVSLTVAEPMPRVAIKVRNMLNELTILKD